MDKKNFTLGALLLVAAFAILFLSPRPTPPPPAPPPAAAPANSAPAAPGATPAAPVPPSLIANVSRDAAEAVRLHGAPRGLLLALRRLLRCTPLHPGGFDPVPLPRSRPAPVCRAATSS